MPIYRIVYVSDKNDMSQGTLDFFSEAQKGAYEAYKETNIMSVEEWNQNCLLYASPEDFPTPIRPQIGILPCVVVRNPLSQVIILRNKGNVFLWKARFTEIFTGSIKESKGKEGSENGLPNGVPDGTGDGTGKESNRFWWWLGAGLSGFAAAQQTDNVAQLGLGGLSAICVYNALGKKVTAPKLPTLPKLPLLPVQSQTDLPIWAKVPQIGRIGWMGVQHLHWVKPYAEFPTKANNYRSKTNLSQAQGQPGVYQIKKNGEIIYIGKGSNVYKTCLRHFEPYEPDHENKQMFYKDYLKNDYKVRITLTGTIQRAKKIEALLLMKHRPKLNKYIPSEIPFVEKEEYVPF
jgi:hypothetical protein